MADINKVYTEIQSETNPPERVDGVTIFSPTSTIFEGEATRKEGDNFFVANNKLASYRLIVGTDRTLWNQLKRVKDILPNGPYMMDSRDDGISIHNHKFNQAPKVSYTYAGGNGELLDLSIKTQKRAVSVQATQSSQVDPRTKSITTSISQSCDDPTNNIRSSNQDQITERAIKELWATVGKDKGNPKSSQILRHEKRLQIIKSTRDEETTKRNLQSTYKVTQEDVNNYLQQIKGEWGNMLNDAKQSGNIYPLVSANSMGRMVVKTKVPVRMKVNPTDYATLDVSPNTAIPGYSQHDISNSARRYGSGVRYLKSQPNIIILPSKRKYAPDAQPRLDIIMEKEIELELDGARIFSSATPQQIQDALSTNQLGDYTQKQVKATLRVLGRPELESSMILEIKNISDKYSGEWYTKKIKHSLDNSGYSCTCELIQKPSPITISRTTSVVNTQDIYSEFNKVAKKKLASGNNGIVSDIKAEFIKLIKENPELAKKSLVVDVDKYEKADSTGKAFPVYPASQDQVDLAKEREKYYK